MTPDALRILNMLRRYLNSDMMLYAHGFANALIDRLPAWEQMYVNQIMRGKA